MGTKFFYALILTVAGIVFRLLLYFTGFETEKLATGQYLQWIMLPVVGAIYWMGLKAVRDEKPVPSLTYGQGVGAGAIISLISAAMSAVYNFIHLKFVNTSLVDYQIDLMRTQWAAKGLNDTAMENAESMTRAMMTPAISSCFALVFGFVFGLIISLIVAAIVKRPAPAGAVPPPM